MRTSSLEFTGRDHGGVPSEIAISGDTTVARTKYTNVYRETEGGSLLAYRVPATRIMTTYWFKDGDIDDDYFMDDDHEEVHSTTPTPHGDTIGDRLDHPSRETHLPCGVALQIYDHGQHTVQGTVHCHTGHLRLEPGEEITIITNDARKEEPSVYHIDPSASSTLNPGGIGLPSGSRASHTTREGWKLM